MEVLIGIPELGTNATQASIINNHTDVAEMHMEITVGLFNDAGDKLMELTVEYTLPAFPIPSPDEQLEIIRPTIEQYQAEHPALPQE